MKKEFTLLSTLPDHVVKSLSSNDYVTMYYSGKQVTNITVVPMGGVGKASAKYRINTTTGQYRSDEPLIEFLC